MKTDYQYYADGSLKYAQDQLDERFDRAYSFDHRSLVKEAYSGSEARDYVNGTNSGTQTGPYRQSFQHDVFGNLTQGGNRFWSRVADPFIASYTSQRRVGFGYDADGRLTQDDDLQYNYDAAGRNVSTFSDAQSRTVTSVVDGAGQVVKSTETQSTSKTTYYLRSSVLGGRVITELNQSGAKEKGYVLAGGAVLAEQHSGVRWQHENPVTGSRGYSHVWGGYTPAIERDATGVNVGLEDPYLNPPPTHFHEPFTPTLFNDGSCGGCNRCSLNGFQMDCEVVAAMADNRALAIEFTPPEGRQLPIQVPIDSRGLGVFYADGRDVPPRTVDPEIDEDRLDRAFQFLDFGLGQDRSDLKIDRDVFKNKKTPTHPGLPPCVKDYLSKFFDRDLLDAITWEQGIPLGVPGGNDNGGFTLGDHIYFGTNGYNPLDGISLREIVLIGHELTHSRQYRTNGSLRQIGKYLADSAVKGVAATALFGPAMGWELSYYGNKFEKEALDMEKKLINDLAKTTIPCP